MITNAEIQLVLNDPNVKWTGNGTFGNSILSDDGISYLLDENGKELVCR